MSEERNIHPTYSGLDEEQKVVNLLWVIQLEKRRGAIVVFSLVFYAVIWNYAASVVGLSQGEMGLILAPLVAATIVVAIFKPGGHYPEWWAERWLSNFWRPSVLLSRRRDGDNPLKEVRQSVQDALPLDHIEWNWIKTGGIYIIVLRVEPYSVSMASEEERRKLWQGATSYYKNLDFPVIEVGRVRPGSTLRYQRHLHRALSGELGAMGEGEERQRLAEYGQAHLDFAARVGERYSISESQNYLVIPYTPEGGDSRSVGMPSPSEIADSLRRTLSGSKPRPSKTADEQAADEAAYGVLSLRARMVYDSLARMGCRAYALSDSELLAFFASQSTDVDEDPDEPPILEEPVMLEVGGYEALSEKQIRDNVSVAESVRAEAPPTIGTARLTVRDSVSPDAIVRHPDYLKVGARYHKTRYVSGWPEDAWMGILDRLEALDGRIKTVKYIDPRDQEEAINRYGDRAGELDASLASDTSGNVVTRRKKETAQYNAHLALQEVANNRQGYVRISFFIHLEADTYDELTALDYRVWRTLNTLSIQSRTAREEAWEGFLTCLPLGADRLSASTDCGMLTNALACLTSFTTTSLAHDGGILLGLDLGAGGAPVIYDDWQLSRPGSVTLGPPDTGKTFATKADATRKRAVGHRIVILDPSANSYYNHVARSIGGEYAFLAEGSPHKVNPFDLHQSYMDLGLMTDAFAESVEDPEAVTRRARASALKGKVLALTKILELMAGGLSAAETGFAESAFSECYRRKGVTEDPATHDGEMPTFSGGGECDFFTVLGEYAEDNPQVVGGLMERLRSWADGPMSDLFDSQTNVDLANKFLVLQIASLQERAKPVMMQAIMEFTSGVLSNPDEIADFFIDEFHNLLYDEASARYAESWYRTARVRATSVHAISQDTEEFAASRQGRVIMNTAGTARIFNQGTSNAARAVGEIYGLSEPEVEGLKNLSQGMCYFLAGRSRHTLQILASPEEEALFDTSPGADSRHRQRKATQGGEGSHGGDQEPTVEIPAEYMPPREATEPLDEEPHEGAPSYDEDRPDLLEGEGMGEKGGGDGARPYASPSPSEADTHHGAHGSQGAAPEESQSSRQTGLEGLKLPGESDAEPTEVYAFTGEGAAASAAAVARVLGEEAHQRGLFVAAIDATTPGGALLAELGVEPPQPPDRFLAAGRADTEDLGLYVGRVFEESPALMAVGSPEMDVLSATALMEAATEVFDVVIVACGAVGSVYSGEWLEAADRVVGCSPASGGSALEAALGAEEARSTNGTLLATSAAACDDPAEGSDEGAKRALFTSVATDESARLALTQRLITEKEEE